MKDEPYKGTFHNFPKTNRAKKTPPYYIRQTKKRINFLFLLQLEQLPLFFSSPTPFVFYKNLSYHDR